MICHGQLKLGLLVGLAALAWPIAAGAQAPLTSEPPPPAVQPQVDDPMLAPPEAAPAEVKSWDEAIDMIRRSPDFLTSAAQVDRALAQHRVALAAVLPQLFAQGAYEHNFKTLSVPFDGATLVAPPPTVWSIAGTLEWNILSPRAIYGLGTSDIATDIATLSLADRKRVLAGSVISALLATLAAERVAELDRVGLRAALERLVLTQTRLKFARGTELDVDRAQQDVAAARAALISGDESLRQAREALGQALGSATPLAAPASLDLEGFERAVATTCRINADVDHRADVVAARARVELADRQINDVKLQFAPTLGVNAEAGYASASTLGPNTTIELGATLTIPLYDGGARYGQLRDAKASALQARDELTSVRIAAMIENARAQRAVSVDTASRDVAKEQRDLAQRVDTRTREGYIAGVGTSLDLVTSAQALRAAEINLVLLDFQLAQARAGAVLSNAECMF